MKPSIVDTFTAEGIELVRYGSRLKCHCPIHAEKTASCVLFPDENRWHCFGCHKGGDAYAFIMAYKGINFKEAKKYIDGADSVSDEEYALRRAKSEARREFREWCKAEYLRLFNLTLHIRRIMQKAPSIDYIEGRGCTEAVRNFSKYIYHLDILQGNNDKAKFGLYRQSRGI